MTVEPGPGRLVLLTRHAVAAPRSTWTGDDARRPLTSRGERQAAALVGALAPYWFQRVISSPALRCAQTVRPLAEARGVRMETAGSLREGRGARALDLVLDLVESCVICTHGDVIEAVLEGLCKVGWPVSAETPSAKGSVWALSPRSPASYIAPVT
jgi:8-oxo-dGTP diphosphatase